MKKTSPSVSRYFAELARKSNRKQRGTAAAKRRARKAARARWARAWKCCPMCEVHGSHTACPECIALNRKPRKK